MNINQYENTESRFQLPGDLLPMVFSRILDKVRAMERECREGTNEENFSGRIRFIRQFAQHLHLAQVQVFALKEIRTLRKPCVWSNFIQIPQNPAVGLSNLSGQPSH
jgi:hypothetical protein